VLSTHGCRAAASTLRGAHASVGEPPVDPTRIYQQVELSA